MLHARIRAQGAGAPPHITVPFDLLLSYYALTLVETRLHFSFIKRARVLNVSGPPVCLCTSWHPAWIDVQPKTSASLLVMLTSSVADVSTG